MFLAVNHANGTLICYNLSLYFTYVLVASPPVSPAGERIPQPPASLSVVTDLRRGQNQ